MDKHKCVYQYMYHARTDSGIHTCIGTHAPRTRTGIPLSKCIPPHLDIVCLHRYNLYTQRIRTDTNADTPACQCTHRFLQICILSIHLFLEVKASLSQFQSDRLVRKKNPDVQTKCRETRQCNGLQQFNPVAGTVADQTNHPPML